MTVPNGYDPPSDIDFIETINKLARFGEVELADPCRCCNENPMVIFTRQEFLGIRIDGYCVVCDAMHEWPLTEFGPEDYDEDDRCYKCPACHGCTTHGECRCERCGECFELRDDCECEEGFLEEDE